MVIRTPNVSGDFLGEQPPNPFSDPQINVFARMFGLPILREYLDTNVNGQAVQPAQPSRKQGVAPQSPSPRPASTSVPQTSSPPALVQAERVSRTEMVSLRSAIFARLRSLARRMARTAPQPVQRFAAKLWAELNPR